MTIFRSYVLPPGTQSLVVSNIGSGGGKSYTPRTDAEVKLRERLPATNHGVSAEFARQLEHELSTERAEVERVCVAHKGLMAEADRRAEALEAEIHRLQIYNDDLKWKLAMAPDDGYVPPKK